ncbi:MAG: DUF3795 domain-containing protein [Desulfobacteraceae bacterium]|nr:DUF3795 domain-containing protein [Desulfobacteraceae bacterium]
MSKMIAYCGLVCSTCPTFIATKNDDDTARKKTAIFYSEQFGFDLKPEDINCDGCLSDGGKLIGYCQACKIRKCCKEKNLESCVVCDDQPCEELSKFHDFSPVAKKCFEVLINERD